MFSNFSLIFFGILVIISVSMYNLSFPQKIYLSELGRTYLFSVPAWFFSDVKKYVDAAEKTEISFDSIGGNDFGEYGFI